MTSMQIQTEYINILLHSSMKESVKRQNLFKGYFEELGIYRHFEKKLE